MTTSYIGIYDRKTAFDVARALARQVRPAEVWILPRVQLVGFTWGVDFEVYKDDSGNNFDCDSGVLIDGMEVGGEVVDQNAALDEVIAATKRQFA